MERRVILEMLLGIYRIDKKYKQKPNGRRKQGSRGKRFQRFSNFDSNDSEYITNQEVESQCGQTISKQASFISDFEDDNTEEYNLDYDTLIDIQDDNLQQDSYNIDNLDSMLTQYTSQDKLINNVTKSNNGQQSNNGQRSKDRHLPVKQTLKEEASSFMRLDDKRHAAKRRTQFPIVSTKVGPLVGQSRLDDISQDVTQLDDINEYSRQHKVDSYNVDPITSNNIQTQLLDGTQKLVQKHCKNTGLPSINKMKDNKSIPKCQLVYRQSMKSEICNTSSITTKQSETTKDSAVGSMTFKQNHKVGSLQYGELCRQDSRIPTSQMDQQSIRGESRIKPQIYSLNSSLTTNNQANELQNIDTKYQITETPACIRKLSKSFGVLPDSLLSAFISFNSGDELNLHNIGLIKKQTLNMYMQNPFNLFNSEQMLDSQLLKLISDYIIQAYSYDYSVIRIQQSNVLIKIQFIIKQLIEEFEIEPADEELLEQMLHNIVNIDKRNQELRVKTIFCCNRVMVGHSDKFLICNNCGKMCNFQKKSIRKDRNEGSQRNTSYHSIRHFDDVFKQLFIQPIEPIDSITKLQLQDFMNRDHKQKVTIEDVRQYLKQLPGGKGSKLNKSDAFIMGLLNGETLKISATEYSFIKNTFQQFIQVLYKNTDIRKNTPNCVSFIKNIIDLLYKDIDAQRHIQIVKRLHQQKENTTRKMQKTWQFIISQFDIQAIKQDFKNTLKRQTN